MSSHEHTSVSMDEEKQQLVSSITAYKVHEAAISNHDLQNNNVNLLDISCNKEWIAYISTSKTEYYPSTTNYKTSITRRRFSSEYDLEHFSLTINGDLNQQESSGTNHCKFLSVSADGNYIVFSFFERNLNAGDSTNPYCLLYKVTSNGIELQKKIPFQGRAVFLENTLSLIHPDFLEIYDSTFKRSHWFDLRSLSSTSMHDRRVENQNSFIKNASWVSFNGRDGDNGDMKKLITYTRHTRNQVLVTPYSGGIVRVWSMKDGVRSASFRVQPHEHIMAFSNDNKIIATFTEGARRVNIYEVKSGLLVYSLHSRFEGKDIQFEVSHLRFCFDDEYLIVTGVERPSKSKSSKINKVVFEAWYIKAEKSIFFQEQSFNLTGLNPEYKYIQPFVLKGYNVDNKKCLYGTYTTIENNNTITKRIELDIDQVATSKDIRFEWVKNNSDPYFKWEVELENNLNQHDNLKCAQLTTADGRKYLLRFGMNMIQLWRLENPNCSEEELLSDNDQLVYIRAYKGPDYGIHYSFREAWVIHNFESIKFLGGYPYGRLVVNITSDEEYDLNNENHGYHTEEIFLPFGKLSSTVDSKKIDYHQLESACQALHYLYMVSEVQAFVPLQSHEQYTSNRSMILKKTEELVEISIERIRKKSGYFTTVAGSRILAMLASFDKGRKIIQTILLNGDVPIRVFSYPRSFSEMNKYTQKYGDEWLEDEDDENNDTTIASSREEMFAGGTSSSENFTVNPSYRNSPTKITKEVSSRKKKKFSQSVAPNENVLTVLAEESSHLLFRLLFNRVLYDSKEIGTGCLTAMTDTVFFLQSMQLAKGDSFYTLIVNCIEKLTFLSVNPDTLAVLRSELTMYQCKNAFSPKYSSSLIYLDSFSAKEQITRYNSKSIVDYLYYICVEFARRTRGYFFLNSNMARVRKMNKREWIANQVRKGKQKWSTYQSGVQTTTERPAGLSLLCVVPLIGFNAFLHDTIHPEKKSSAFDRMVTDKHNRVIFEKGGNVIDILLQNKWKNFARRRFAFMFFIYLIFFVAYIAGVSFSQPVFGYEPGTAITNSSQIACTAIMFIFIIAIFFQSMRRLFTSQSKLDYFSSVFNCFEIVAVVIVPALSFLFMRFDWPYRREGISTCTLLLWFHAILKLRVFPFIGVTLETIIQLWRSVAPVFAVMLFVICAFTNAFMVLLQDKDDAYFQEKFVGNLTASVPPSVTNDTAIQDSSQSNQFDHPLKAFYTVWFFMYGAWDPAVSGDAGDNVMIMILATLFTFFTILIFFNLTIARMAGAVERVTKLGDKIWITHFAAVLSEIELLWCSERVRESRVNNPKFVFYNANAVSIQKHGLRLRNETDKLMNALKSNHEFVEDFGE